MNDGAVILETVEIAEILKTLPHRYPFLMVDRIINVRGDESGIGIKNVTVNEPQFLGHFPGNPVFPGVLVIEGMAQTAGILVGEARNFSEKVILAKIGRATFHRLVRPGDTITFAAKIDQLSEQGASIAGTVTVNGDPVADIELMFSHIDQNLAGLEFPEHNFVFTEQFTELLKTYRIDSKEVR